MSAFMRRHVRPQAPRPRASSPPMPLSLSDHQFQMVVTSLQPLPPEKRGVVLERVAATLRQRLGTDRRPIDADVAAALRRSLVGLLHERVA